MLTLCCCLPFPTPVARAAGLLANGRRGVFRVICHTVFRLRERRKRERERERAANQPSTSIHPLYESTNIHLHRGASSEMVDFRRRPSVRCRCTVRIVASVSVSRSRESGKKMPTGRTDGRTDADVLKTWRCARALVLINTLPLLSSFPPSFFRSSPSLAIRPSPSEIRLPPLARSLAPVPHPA